MNSILSLHAQIPLACAGSMDVYGVQGTHNSVFFWEIDGGAAVDTLYGLNNDSVVVRWDYQRRNHTITVTEYSEFGCAGIPVTASITVNAPVVDIGDNLEVCADTSITIIPALDNPDVTYLWSDGSTGNHLTANEEGTYWVRVTDTDRCIDYDSVYLTVNPLPVVSLGKDTVLCGTQSMVLDPGYFSNYLWSTGDVTHQLEIDGMRTEPEMIWVKVVDFNGCKGGDTIIFEVCDAALLFANMPNTITPGVDGSDDDGFNDEWVIPYIDLFPDAVLEIFDRWGRLVYRTDKVAHEPWRGQSLSGKELPMDAYYFILDIKVAHVKPVTGYVNLIR